MFGARRLRWNVKVQNAGIPDKYWRWVEEKGPWYLYTERPRSDYDRFDEVDLDDLDEYMGVTPEQPHRCPTSQLLYLRTHPDNRPRAIFDVVDFYFGSYVVRLTAYDCPPKKSGRTARKVELEITPDLSDAVAELVGASEHPYQKRDDETMAELANFRRPR